MSEQDYIPGTTVIKNLVDRDDAHPHGTADQKYLEQAETMFVSDRLKQLRENPVQGAFTFGHMRQIHQHLFQDVYSWAGEPRRVPMQKRSTSYAEPAEMSALLRQQYSSIAEQDYLRGINDREEFTRRLASLWAEINHGHAFREGNTRSQTVFFEQLTRNAGWSLDVARLSPHHSRSVYKPFVDARFEHQRIRDTESLSAQEAALELAKVLSQVIEADPSPEGQLRRGMSPAPATSTTSKSAATVNELHARHPELRDMKLDPYGLGGLEEASDHSPSSNTGADDNYQR